MRRLAPKKGGLSESQVALVPLKKLLGDLLRLIVLAKRCDTFTIEVLSACVVSQEGFVVSLLRFRSFCSPQVSSFCLQKGKR
jgi:hypothetical protein